MEEVSASPIWTTDNKGFAEDQDLYSLGESNTRQLFRQSHNVEHLHQILRKGLDTDMPDLLFSDVCSESLYISCLLPFLHLLMCRSFKGMQCNVIANSHL